MVSAGLGCRPQHTAAAAGFIFGLKLIQSFHMLFYAPYRTLSVCYMAFLIVMLEASVAFMLMYNGSTPDLPGASYMVSIQLHGKQPGFQTVSW